MASPSSSSLLSLGSMAEPLETSLLISPIPQKPNPDPDSERISLSPATDDEIFLAEYRRLARVFATGCTDQRLPPFSFIGSSSSTSVVAAPDAHLASLPFASCMFAKKKKKMKKDRSAEMVRISSPTEQDQIHFRDIIRRARTTFESLRLLIIQDEARRESLGVLEKRSRADLKAAAFMSKRGLWLNRDKRIIGSIPGICIGDFCFFRVELCVIGLHGHLQAGIDYVSAGRSSSGEPIATSIIVSGGYEDDEDRGDVLIYTGHGGLNRNQHKMYASQKLERGNLALERSMNYGIEIRVIRGMKINHGPAGMVYVYDGLYRVVNYWTDIGKSGFEVYKYKLLRIEGQEEMGSAMFKLAASLKLGSWSVRKSFYFCNDISMGRESFPVSLYNDLDYDKDPLQFQYSHHPIYPPAILEKVHGDGRRGCECETKCSAECYCATLNGGEFAYDASGVLLRGKPLIYECGTACRCQLNCPNRVSQKGIRRRLEVFRSNETVWGVRSWDFIQAGTFICEFSGMVLTKEQAELLSVARRSLVQPNGFPTRWVEWGDISDVFSDYMPSTYPYLPELNFSLDVTRARNVACYLSHSCSPNVFMQFVLYDHYNLSYPHLMVFALENIPPLRELSIDYGVIDEWSGKLTVKSVLMLHGKWGRFLSYRL
ncbi:hypothetical protein M5K25_018586 [Dendrobium thyrsiflorum]|uniref:Uncharacterized protein n=1 Tax=Dendrobium thyrsiflorum TaxID=117978 RepID=A0ABD0UIN1_DENTH